MESRRPGALLLSFLWLGIAALACGQTADQTAAEQTPHPPDRRDNDPKEPPPAAAATAPPTLEPLPAPRAYFGELSLPRLTEPLQFTPSPRSSVLLIVVDAFNAKHLGIYGYQRQTTPRLDQLAGQGLLYSNYVSNSSWTRPSFTTIITGLPKKQHQIEWSGNHLEMKITTLAERFRAAGYSTAAFVGNQLMREIWGFAQGFQTFVDTESIGHVHPRDEILMDETIRWLKKRGDKPFFVTVFMIGPHAPYRPLRANRQFLDELPKGRVIAFPHREYLKPLPELDHQRLVAAYDGEINYVDHQIGRLIDFLDRQGKLASTSIAITADHGEAMGEHGCYTHTYHMWEPVLRVPLILVSGALSARGIHDDRPYTHLDIAPTLLDLAGIEYDAQELPGISLARTATDPQANRKRTMLSQYNAHGVRRQAIRRGRWKLIHHHQVKESARQSLLELQLPKNQPDPRNLPTLSWKGERYELYDLVEDPAESKNLYQSKQGTPELNELLAALREHLGDKEPTREVKMTPEMIKSLENIGYLARPHKVGPRQARPPDGGTRQGGGP